MAFTTKMGLPDETFDQLAVNKAVFTMTGVVGEISQKLADKRLEALAVLAQDIVKHIERAQERPYRYNDFIIQDLTDDLATLAAILHGGYDSLLIPPPAERLGS